MIQNASKNSPKNLSKRQPKIALVHDYLREYGGAERVLETLHKMYPDAPVYTAFYDAKSLGQHWNRFKNWEIRQTWMSRIPGILRLYSPLRILAARAFSSLDLSEFDVVISSTNAYMAKAVRVPHGVHICYCHTPPRSLYGYSTMSDWKKKWWMRVPGELINHVMRIIDFKTAQDVDVFIANSHETAKRIRKFYRRESTVIFPPVHVASASKKMNDSKKMPAKEKSYAIYVNRLAFAKHPELAVQACTELGMQLKVVGTGPLLPELQAVAGPTVTFLGSVTDQELHELYAGASVLLYPVEDEDFGIVPIEAMGHGVPVIAHASGGPLETIIEGKTGVFFEELTTAGLIAAIKEFNELSAKSSAKNTSQFDATFIKKHAQQYDASIFEERIEKLLRKSLLLHK